jgi:streptomycin 6-kinase
MGGESANPGVLSRDAGNVVSAQRNPWLVIDPNPFVGDPAYDATQHLLNCPARMAADPLGTVARYAGLLGVDRARVAGWMFGRLSAEPRDDWRPSPWSAVAETLRDDAFR